MSKSQTQTCAPGDPRERDIDAALETASACRQDASIARQSGFREYARWLDENARKAERWAAKR